MKRIQNLALVAIALYVIPVISIAQGSSPPPLASGNNPLGNVLIFISDIFRFLIPLLTGAALVFFIWHLIGVIRDPANEDARKGIVWGIIALFVIVSIWGIVRFVGTTLGIDENESVNHPLFPGDDSSSHGASTGP